MTENEPFRSELSLFLAKSSKELQRTEDEEMMATMVLSSLSETQEAEAFAWNIGNPEVRSRVRVFQIAVVLSTINLRPRVFCPVV